MQNRYKGFLIGIGFLASAYVGHRTIVWGESYLDYQRQQIACAWLNGVVMAADFDNSSISKTTLIATQELCWAESKTMIDKKFNVSSNITHKGKNKSLK